MELNDKAPYRHWHTVCAACGKATLARPCSVPGEIKAVEHNPVVKCQHCEDTRQYLTTDCFLAPLSAAATVTPASVSLCLCDGVSFRSRSGRRTRRSGYVPLMQKQRRSRRHRPFARHSSTAAAWYLLMRFVSGCAWMRRRRNLSPFARWRRFWPRRGAISPPTGQGGQVVTVEYSVRCAANAVYCLLGIDRKPHGSTKGDTIRAFCMRRSEVSMTLAEIVLLHPRSAYSACVFLRGGLVKKRLL
jgi:hypothetical protein